MKTVALRFGEFFSPDEGTIRAHEKIIAEYGFVWYGKMGTPLSQKIIDHILSLEDPKILLIHSGGSERYWAYIEDIKKEQPDSKEFPDYYHEKADKFKTWFKVKSFENAPKSIMSECTVVSSGARLTEASRHSMSPYFIINVDK